MSQVSPGICFSECLLKIPSVCTALYFEGCALCSLTLLSFREGRIVDSQRGLCSQQGGGVKQRGLSSVLSPCISEIGVNSVLVTVTRKQARADRLTNASRRNSRPSRRMRLSSSVL